MMLFRVILLLAAATVVTLLLTYALTKSTKYISWAFWVGKLTLGLALLFGILYVLERLVML
jgi:hypothetical protein